uniref:Protein-arginine deiminase type-2 n=1 Tax=Sphaerodactylus townsendi TaxID=933632 RepID=A0ACB8EE42_9SAUR
MLRERTLRLQFGNRIEAVCVVGSRLSIDVYGAAPAEALTFSVKHTEGLEVDVITHDQLEPAPTNGGKQWPLDPKTILKVQMTRPSTEANDNKVTVGYYGENGGPPIDQAGVFLTGIGISLDVDADRDGVVEKNNPRKASWTWGPDGQGAVLLVNCDKENPFIAVEDCQDDKVYCKEDLEDMSRMMLRTQGPDRLPPGYEMVLYIPMCDSDKVGVFYLQNPFFGQRYIHVLGRRKLFHVVKYTGGSAELEFFVEGLRFPDEGFNGLVTVHVSLLEKLAEGIPQTPIFTDSVVFRVAPWIMTPNTLAPVTVFVCSVKDNFLHLLSLEGRYKGTW